MIEEKEAESGAAGKVVDRALTKKRLVIYLLFSFGLTWTPMFLFIGMGGKYDMEEAGTALLLAASMLWPTVAALLAGKLTGEGLAVTGEASMLLGISFRDGKWIWYVAAFVLPLAGWLLGDALWFVLVPESFNPDMLGEAGFGGAVVLLIPMMGMASAVTVSFGALGEEIGWRTYLYPKLEQLFGLDKALLYGGIIWGVWHFPMVAVGHGFGTGYFGEPYTGFLVFTLDTVSMGCLLYLVTKQSGSVWPAAFLHAFSNTGADIFRMCMDEGKITGIWADSVLQAGIMTTGSCVLGYVAYRILRRSYPVRSREQGL